MKIIKEGIHPDKQIFTGTCPTCKSVIEAFREELSIDKGCYRTEGEFGEANCPLCKASMIFYPVK